MVFVDVKLVVWKFDTVAAILAQTRNAWLGGLALTGIAALFAMVAACLVCFIAPSCMGSGLPEAKSYLNGNSMPGMFTLRSFFVRAVGVVFSTASGLPVGREGPMVGIGGGIGYGVVHMLALPHMKKWVKLDSNAQDGFSNAALVMDEETFTYTLRIGTVMGSAAGLACAFNAPLGGILYMFEEVTVTNWAPELTFMCFASAVLATIVARLMMSLMGQEAHRLLIFDPDVVNADPTSSKYEPIDLLFIALMSACVGLFSVLFAKGLAWTWTRRNKNRMELQGKSFGPYVRIMEAMLVAALVAMVFSLIPSWAPCEVGQGSGASGSRRLLLAEHSADHRPRRLGLIYAQYTCKDNEQNIVATLLLSGAEGAVKHLFAQGAESFNPAYLILTLAFYFLLAMCMPGLPVPMGVFVPSLLMGSLWGRFFGELLQGVTSAHAGIYGMCGAAAMLGGFTHMTLAIVVLLAEAASDLSLVPLLMLSISVSHIVSTSISHHGYDEVLIHKKGVPFIDAEIPHELETCVALDLMDDLPDQCLLPGSAALDVVREALQQPSVALFPVLEEDGSTIGICTRARLEAAVDTHLSPLIDETAYDRAGQEQVDRAANVTGLIKAMMRRPSLQTSDGFMVPITRLMDAVPHVLLEDMPAARFYGLFACGAVQATCVVSKRGEFRGILARRNLIGTGSNRMTNVSQSENRSPVKKVSEDKLDKKA